jgi:hypothetical protein
MDAKFHPAIKAINSDDLETLKALVAADRATAHMIEIGCAQGQ